MASEEVVEVTVRRYILTGSQSFSAVLDGIFSGIGQPDIGQLFSSPGLAPLTRSSSRSFSRHRQLRPDAVRAA
jgi:hypothetical protein